MHADPWLIAAVVIGILSAPLWAYAYFLFPKAVDRVMRNIDMGPFLPHLVATRNWVNMCGWSHLIMASRDIAMLVAMYCMWMGAYEMALSILFGTLLPLFWFGWYSVRRIREFHRDAPDINRFVHQASRVLDV